MNMEYNAFDMNYSYEYVDYTNMRLCMTEEQLQTLGEFSANFTIDLNCSEGNGTFTDFTNFHSSLSSLEKKVLLVIYCNMALVALVMNVFIIVTIITNKLHQKVTYIFIMNLACADVFMLTVNMPISLSYMMLNDWVLGKALCHIAYPTFALPVYVSSWTMMLIALERYFVTHSKNTSGMGMTRRKAIIMIAAIILISVLLAIPLMMYTRYDRPQDHLPAFIRDSRAFCIEQWPSSRAQAIYGSIIIQTQFVLPVTLTMALHGGIYKVFHNRYLISKKRSVTSASKYTKGKSSEALRARKSYKQKKSASEILLGIVVVFVICWSPANIFMMILDTSQDIVPTKKLPLIHCVLRLLATSSSCINPIFYGWSNKAFRLAALKVVKTCGCTRLLQRLSEQSSAYRTSEINWSSTRHTNLSPESSEMPQLLKIPEAATKTASSTSSQVKFVEEDNISTANSCTPILKKSKRWATERAEELTDGNTTQPLLNGHCTTGNNATKGEHATKGERTPIPNTTSFVNGDATGNCCKKHENAVVRFDQECMTTDTTSQLQAETFNKHP